MSNFTTGFIKFYASFFGWVNSWDWEALGFISALVLFVGLVIAVIIKFIRHILWILE